MSKVAITGNASGAGVFTIASPNSATDRTLTLPDETGTVATQAYVGTQSLGVGQTWQDVTGSRSSGVTYTNSTGKPIFLSIYSSAADGTYTITVDGIVVVRDREVNVDITHITIVPNGSTYLISLAGTITWNELR
tara:strand:+ start:383 stop:787 length:405 start_codon:yes stop_codon:yes gene_type:complete